MGTGGPLRQPIPVARSILWCPASAGPKRPGNIPFPIFLSQAALTAIHEHLAAPPRPGQGVLGFLLGDLCECPETNLSYLVIDSAVRLNQAIYGDRTRDVVTRLWDRVQGQLEQQQAHLIGWYHTHPPLPLHLTEHDVETHEQYFGEPWQTALLLGDDPAEPAAGFFRAGSEETWVSALLPFYELLNPESIRPDGRKRSFITWKNYRAYTAVPPAAVTGPRAAVAPHAPAAKAPAEPKFTPAPAKHEPPAPQPLAPPPPRREPDDSGELRFLTAAEDMHSHQPSRTPRRPTPPPRPAPSPPPRRPTPPPRPAPPPPEPELEPEAEPEVAPVAPAQDDEAPAPGWPEEFARGEAAEPAPEEEPAARPRRAPRRRWRVPRKLRVTLLLLVIGAAAGGAYWWFQPEIPLPTWSAVTAGWSAFTAKVAVLSGRGVSALKAKFRRTPPAPAPTPPPRHLPAAPPPRPATVSPSSPPPAQPAPAGAAAPRPVAALDVVGDSLTQAVRIFAERAGLFARGQLPCAGLSGGLSLVEHRWIAYNTARRKAGVLDAARAVRDQRLYAGVDSVERRFEQSGCARP